MRTAAFALVCVLALPVAALLSCTAPAAAPAGRAPDVDRAIDPCRDFDAYANGPWRAANGRINFTQDSTSCAGGFPRWAQNTSCCTAK